MVSSEFVEHIFFGQFRYEVEPRNQMIIQIRCMSMYRCDIKTIDNERNNFQLLTRGIQVVCTAWCVLGPTTQKKNIQCLSYM